MEKQAVYIGRHGKKAQDGESLDIESVPVLYQIGSESLRDFAASLGYNAKRAFLRHSKQKRTLYTGRAILAGAYNLAVPKSQEGLESQELQIFRSTEDPLLAYDSIKSNAEAFKRMGLEPYLEWLVQHPDAHELEGQEITPWNQMLKTGRDSLRGALTSANEQKTPLGVIISHVGLTEPLVLALINTGRQKQLTNPREIGGWLPMEGYALLSLEGDTGEVQRNGEKYKVDLSNL